MGSMDSALWSQIRQLHFVGGLSRQAIAQRLSLSVKTVYRALQRGAPPGAVTGDVVTYIAYLLTRKHTVIYKITLCLAKPV